MMREEVTFLQTVVRQRRSTTRTAWPFIRWSLPYVGGLTRQRCILEHPSAQASQALVESCLNFLERGLGVLHTPLSHARHGFFT